MNFQKNYTPYLNKDLQLQIKENHKQLTTAIKSKCSNEWRKFRVNRYMLNKQIEKAKTDYLKTKLSDNIQGWKILEKVPTLNLHTLLTDYYITTN